MNKNSLTIAAIALLLLTAFFIGRSSKADDQVIVKEDKHRVDSLGKVLDSIRTQDVKFTDSTYTETLKKDSLIAAYEADRAILTQKIRNAGLISDHYAELYMEAIARRDTPTAVVNCDSMAVNYAALEDYSHREIWAADSIITALHEQKYDLNTAFNRLKLDNANLYSSGKDIQKKYNDLFIRYKKKTNWFHRWGLPVLSGIAGGFIVHTLK
jgi:hypothetical protein